MSANGGGESGGGDGGGARGGWCGGGVGRRLREEGRDTLNSCNLKARPERVLLKFGGTSMTGSSLYSSGGVLGGCPTSVRSITGYKSTGE